MIYTSYFGNLCNIPSDIVPIAICGKEPDWYKGLCYKELAPSYDIFSKWKDNGNNDYYATRFSREILETLDVNEVADRLYGMSNNKDIVLLCYEKPTDFCHRHLVAKWFIDNGYKCEEFI